MATQADLTAAAVALSTATDRLSIGNDKLVAAAERVVVALQNADLPDQQSALDGLKASTANAIAAGDKADAEVTKLDGILPAPAPAGV